MKLRASQSQLKEMLKFVKLHPEMKTPKSILSNYRLWKLLASKLNSMDGAKKTTEEWITGWRRWCLDCKKLHATKAPAGLAKSLLDFLNEPEVRNITRNVDPELVDPNIDAIELPADEGTVSFVQFKEMLAFIKQNPELKLPRNSVLAGHNIVKLWEVLAGQLNNLPGAMKSVSRWIKAWNEWKANCKKRRRSIGVSPIIENKQCVSKKDLDNELRDFLETVIYHDLPEETCAGPELSDSSDLIKYGERSFKAGAQHYKVMLDFIKLHPEMKLQRNDITNQLWEELAGQLNRIEGGQRSTIKWVNSWVSWKTKCKRNLDKGVILNHYDKQLLDFMGYEYEISNDEDSNPASEQLSVPFAEEINTSKEKIKQESMPSSQHYRLMLDFIMKSPEMNLSGDCNTSESQLLWKTLTTKLNNLNVFQQNEKEWMTTWMDWIVDCKSKLKRGLTLNSMDWELVDFVGCQYKNKGLSSDDEHISSFDAEEPSQPENLPQTKRKKKHKEPKRVENEEKVKRIIDKKRKELDLVERQLELKERQMNVDERKMRLKEKKLKMEEASVQGMKDLHKSYLDLEEQKIAAVEMQPRQTNNYLSLGQNLNLVSTLPFPIGLQQSSLQIEWTQNSGLR